MPISLRRYIGAVLFLVWVFVLGVALVQAQDDQPEPEEELLRADDRPQLRVLNASTQFSVADVFVDGTLYFPDIPSRCISAYLPLPITTPVQKHSLQVRPGESEEENFVAAVEQDFEADRDYTLLILDGPSGPDPLWLIQDDNQRAISPGQASLRLVRATSPDVPALEVCIADNCALLTPEEKVSNYIEVDAGAYNLKLRLIGTDTLYHEVRPISLKAGEVHSIFVLSPGTGSVQPQVIAYIDTAQLPSYPIDYPTQPAPYPCAGPGQSPAYPPPVLEQPAYPPEYPGSNPEGGYVPPPAYPPVTGAFLSPLARMVAVGVTIVVGGGWLVWRHRRRARSAPSG